MLLCFSLSLSFSFFSLSLFFSSSSPCLFSLPLSLFFTFSLLFFLSFGPFDLRSSLENLPSSRANSRSPGKHTHTKKSYAVTAVALGWSALVCSQLWPPVSILLPEHLRNFKQLVVGLLTCSCIFRRGRGSGSTAKRARKRQRQRARERMRRYYASSGEASIESNYDTGEDDDDDTSDDDDGKNGSGRVSRRSDDSDIDSVKTNSSFHDDSSVLGSVAPGREGRRGALSGSPARGTSANLPSAGGSWGDLSCATSERVSRVSAPRTLPSSAGGISRAAAVASDAPRSSAAAAKESMHANEENAAETAVGSSSGGGGSFSRRLSLAGEAKTIATLLVPTPASFAIWIIDLFVVGALIAASIIDAQRAEIVLHKVPSQS